MGNNLDFLFYKKLPNRKKVPGGCIAGLLTIEGFVKNISEYSPNDIHAETIYKEAERIYFPMQQGYETKGFRAKYIAEHGEAEYRKWQRERNKARHAVKTFSKALYYENKYLEDYEEWKQNNTKSEEPEA